MPDMPSADIAVDADLVSRLVASQHPDLAGPLTLVNNGWDNALYRLGTAHAVRVPRRRIAADLLLHEQAALPGIEARVSTRVPGIVRIGVPSAEFPYAWSIVRWIDGTPGTEVSPIRRDEASEDLAGFIAELHVPGEPDAPINPFRTGPLARRDDAVLGRLDALDARMDTSRLRDAWSAGLSAPEFTGGPVTIHGDLHPGNQLFEASGRLAGVIDFGDTTPGDPATDLASAWLTFTASGRRRFFAALGVQPGSALWLRARGWAVSIGTVLAAMSDDNPAMARLGVQAVEQLGLDD